MFAHKPRLCDQRTHTHNVQNSAFEQSIANTLITKHIVADSEAPDCQGLFRDLIYAQTACNISKRKENVSGYCRNLGPLRAGMRHHGETFRYGNSFPPTFPEVLLAHANPNDWPIVTKHANTTSCLVPALREPRLR